MRWIKSHKLITIVLVIVIVLVVFFAMAIASDGVGNKAEKKVGQYASETSGTFNSFVTGIKENISGIFSYKELQERIEELEKENAQLEQKLTESKLQQEQLAALEELAGELNYEYTEKKFDIISCDVTSFDGSNWTNIFTINKGSESDIEIGDAVINGMGLVGRIMDTGEGWSKVISIIDEDSSVSFRMARERKQFGVVSGTKDGSISGYMMDPESNISEGDVILTSGLGIYPKGLEIGTVKSVVYNSNTLLKEIEIEPAVDFGSLDIVSVIR